MTGIHFNRFLEELENIFDNHDNHIVKKNLTYKQKKFLTGIRDRARKISVRVIKNQTIDRVDISRLAGLLVELAQIDVALARRLDSRIKDDRADTHEGFSREDIRRMKRDI